MILALKKALLSRSDVERNPPIRSAHLRQTLKATNVALENDDRKELV